MIVDEKAQIYNKLSSFYDKLFFVLKPGHKRAGEYIKEQGIEDVLEVGVGTGLTFSHYAPGTRVIGGDMSLGMLEGAKKKISGFPHLSIELKQLDAQNMDFDDNQFSCTYAPSLLSVVPNPKKLLHEMLRVTKVGGKVIVISHFQGDRKQDALFSKAANPLTQRLFGFRTDLSMELIDQLENAKVVAVEKVNPVGPYYLSHMVILEKTS